MSSVQFEYLAPISKQQQTLACPLLVQIIFGSHADLGAPTSKIGEEPITNLPTLDLFYKLYLVMKYLTSFFLSTENNSIGTKE